MSEVEGDGEWGDMYATDGDIEPEVGTYSYYISVATKAEAQSGSPLWKAANLYIRGVLMRCRSEGQTLAMAADILAKAAGKKTFREPESTSSLRNAAKAIRAGKELVLL